MRPTRDELAELLRRVAPYAVPSLDLDRQLDLALLELRDERLARQYRERWPVRA